MNMNNYCSVELIELNKKFTDQSLAMNTNNRRINTQRVSTYAQDMESGNWVFNGEPIIFTTDGRLIQGQHRLLAHKESGYVDGVMTLVVRLLDDYENDAFRTLDCGMKRTYAQVLSMDGITGASHIAAIRRSICVAIRGSSLHPSVGMMEDVGRDYGEIISDMIGSDINFLGFGSDAAKAGFVAAAKAINDTSFVIDFIRSVRSGADLKVDSPQLAYLKFMQSYKVKGGNGLFANFAAACRCIISAKNGERLSCVRIGKKDSGRNHIDLLKNVAEENGVTM